MSDTKKWYEHEENQVRGRKCLPPYDNITIGSYPSDGATKEWADRWDVIINVSCSPDVLFEPSRPDQRIYWIPTNEIGEWAYSNFASFFTLMDYYYEQKKSIYVHCAAGVYRSPSMVFHWLRYHGGLNLFTAYEITWGEQLAQKEFSFSEKDFSKYEYKLLKNYKYQNLPKDFDLFMKRFQHHKGKSFAYIESLLSPTMIDSTQTRTNFYKENKIVRYYYRLRSTIREYITDIRDWWDGVDKYQITNGLSSKHLSVRRAVSNKKYYDELLKDHWNRKTNYDKRMEMEKANGN